MTAQCQTQAEVFEQFARVSRLIEGTDLRIQDIFKVDDRLLKALHVSQRPQLYSFALAIVEGKPVFIGDTLWSTRLNHFITITGIHDPEDTLNYGKYLSFDPKGRDGYTAQSNAAVESLTWQEPKRTFTLNGEELPFPEDTNGRSNTVRGTYYLPEHAFTHFRWDSVDDRDKVQATILKLLNGE